MSESQLWASWSRFLQLWESTFGLRVNFWPLEIDFWSVEGGFGGSLVVSLSLKKTNIFLISRQAQTIKIYLILMCHSILYIIPPVKMILRALFY